MTNRLPPPFDCSLCGRRVTPRRYVNGTNTMGRRRDQLCDRCNFLAGPCAGTDALDAALHELSYLYVEDPPTPPQPKPSKMYNMPAEWPEIAKELGCSRARAQQIYNSAMAKFREEFEE